MCANSRDVTSAAPDNPSPLPLVECVLPEGGLGAERAAVSVRVRDDLFCPDRRRVPIDVPQHAQTHTYTHTQTHIAYDCAPVRTTVFVFFYILLSLRGQFSTGGVRDP